ETAHGAARTTAPQRWKDHRVTRPQPDPPGTQLLKIFSLAHLEAKACDLTRELARGVFVQQIGNDHASLTLKPRLKLLGSFRQVGPRAEIPWDGTGHVMTERIHQPGKGHGLSC